MTSPPVFVYLSSLAAVGPSASRVDELGKPVSEYGRSKRGGEVAVQSLADRMATTIVRPPIVLGEWDRVGLAMFQGIANWGLHFVPSFSDHRMSVIHAEDLASALIAAASRGKRITPLEDSEQADADGFYYAAADETPTYAELGQMIGEVMGRRRTFNVRVPTPAVWCVAAINETISQCIRKPLYLNLDKAREATAGSWTCTAERLKADTGFALRDTLATRLAQTIKWYVEAGDLPERCLTQLRHQREYDSQPRLLQEGNMPDADI